MTIHDRLVTLGADDRETLDIVAAARAGDAALLAMLLAPDVAVDAEDVAAATEAAALDDGSRTPLDQVRAELRI